MDGHLFSVAVDTNVGFFQVWPRGFSLMPVVPMKFHKCDVNGILN